MRILVSPSYSCAVIPLPFSCLSESVCEYAFTVLFTILPTTIISGAIRLRVDSSSMLLIILVLTFIHPTIWPSIDPVAVDHVVFPMTLVVPTIRPKALSFAIYHIFFPLTLVNRIIVSASVDAISSSFSIIECTFIS
jgi:hypothetical protein